MLDPLSFDPPLNMARQALYRFAALTLLDPRAGCWQSLRALGETTFLADAAAFVRSEPRAKAGGLGPGERPLQDLDPAAVLARLPESPAAFNEGYERTFGLLVSSGCPPYELEYINSKFTFQRSHSLADIGGFYRAFGLQTSQSHPERQDHVVLELEFMAWLLGLERTAAESQEAGRDERKEVCQAAQQRFFREHLAWWIPAFARLLAHQDPQGFYQAAATFLAALIAAERSLLGVLPLRESVAPTTLERPEECDGCLLQA